MPTHPMTRPTALVATLMMLILGASGAWASDKPQAWYMQRVERACQQASQRGIMPPVGKVQAGDLPRLAQAPCADVRGAAIYALGEIKDGRQVPLLINALRADGDAHNRRMAAHALAKLGDRRAIAPLIDVLHDRGNPLPLRFEAADALGRLHTPQAVNALGQVGHDENLWLRKKAQRTLNQIKSGDQATQMANTDSRVR